MGIEFGRIALYFAFYAFVIAILAMVIVSLLTKKTAENVLDDTQTGWYISK